MTAVNSTLDLNLTHSTSTSSSPSTSPFASPRLDRSPSRLIRGSSAPSPSQLHAGAKRLTPTLDEAIADFLQQYALPTANHVIMRQEGLLELELLARRVRRATSPRYVVWQGRSIRLTTREKSDSVLHVIQQFKHSIDGLAHELAVSVERHLKTNKRYAQQNVASLLQHRGQVFLREIHGGPIKRAEEVTLTILRELGKGGYSTALEVEWGVQRKRFVLLVGHHIDDPGIGGCNWTWQQLQKIIHVGQLADQLHAAGNTGIPVIYHSFALVHPTYSCPSYAYLMEKLKPLGNPTAKERVALVMDLRRKVRALHRNGFYHGDISLRNVMKRSAEEAVLTDIDPLSMVEEADVALLNLAAFKERCEERRGEPNTDYYLHPDYKKQFTSFVISKVRTATNRKLDALKYEFLRLRKAKDCYALDCVSFEILTGYELTEFASADGVLDFKAIRSALRRCPSSRYNDTMREELNDFPPRELRK